MKLLLHRALLSLPLAAWMAAVGCSRSPEPVQRGQERVITVETEPVQVREWQLVARAVGSLAADEQVRVRNEVAGMIRAIQASEGDSVEEGDVLVMIDDERAALDVKKAEAQFEEAKANLNRRLPLFDQNLITEAEIIEAQSHFKATEADLGLARRRLADTTVRAPIDGELGRRYISRGDYAEVGTLFFDLVQLDPLKLDFELPERYLSLLRVGQHVRVRTTAYPERVFEGQVFFIDPLINLSTRTIPLRAVVNNAEGFLRPNLFVNVELDVSLIDRALVIPEQAVISDLGGYSVYVVNAEERADIRSVVLGEREPGWVQIRDGLAEGERVVTAGHQRLQPGILTQERTPSKE